MDNNPASFSVATFGLSDKDLGIIGATLAGTQGRVPSFRAFDVAEEMPPNIVIVRAGSPPSNRDWEDYRRSFGSDVVISLIEYGAGPRRNPLFHSISTLASAGLLPLMQRLVAKEHGFNPNGLDGRGIGDPAPASSQTGPRVTALAVLAGLPIRSQLEIGLAGLMGRVDFATASKAALQLVDKHRYDIIFVDAQLPRTEWNALCKTVKSDPRINARLVILCNSSYSEDQAKVEYADFDGHLIRPLDRNMIKKRVLDGLPRTGSEGSP